jgi:GTP-binding protein
VNPIVALLHRAQYRDSIHNLSQLPPDAGIEIAIAGRSNAGKSSLINRLCRQNGLAKTSRTPGRTRQLVFFQLDEVRHLVDLPGYGYAKVSGDLKRHWHGLIQTYLDRRQALSGVIVVMDIRHPLKDSDIELIEWAGSRGLPLHLILTKADKLGRGAQGNALLAVRKEMQSEFGDGASVQLFSGESKIGVDEARRTIRGWLGLY